MNQRRLVPRFSSKSPVHHSNLKSRQTDAPPNPVDAQHISKDSLEMDSESLPQGSKPQLKPEIWLRGEDMEADSLEEDQSLIEESLSETEEEASRKAARLAGKETSSMLGPGTKNSQLLTRDKYSDLRYDPNWKEKKEEVQLLKIEALPMSAGSSVENVALDPLYPSKETSMELPEDKGEEKGTPPSNTPSLLGSEFVSPNYEQGARRTHLSELSDSDPAEKSSNLSQYLKSSGSRPGASQPSSRGPRRRKSRQYFVEKNKLTLGFPTPKMDSYLQLHSKRRGETHLEQIFNPVKVTGQTSIPSASETANSALQPEDKWHQRAQQLKNYQEQWSQHESTKSSNVLQGISSDTTDGPQPFRRPIKRKIRKRYRRRMEPKPLVPEPQNTEPSQEEIPTATQQQLQKKPANTSNRQEPMIIIYDTTTSNLHLTALGNQDPKVVSNIPAPPKQIFDGFIYKNPVGYHSVRTVNMEREPRDPEERHLVHQQPHPPTLANTNFHYSNELSKRQGPGGPRGTQAAANTNTKNSKEKKKHSTQPKQTYAEAKYKNLEILWKFHPASESQPPARTSPNSRLAEIMEHHQQALMQLAEVQPGEGSAQGRVTLPPILSRVESESQLPTERKQRKAVPMGRSNSESYLFQLQRGSRQRKRSSVQSSKLKVYEKRDVKLGGLGPDLESTRDKMQKLIQQKEYAKQVKEYNMKTLSLLSKTPTAKTENRPVIPRQKALEYAKTIPKPKSSMTDTTSKEKKNSTNAGKEETLPEISLLELLQSRHEREKQAVAAFKVLHIV